MQRWVLEKFKEKNAMSLMMTQVLEKLTCILDRSTSTLPNIVQRWDVVLMRHFMASKVITAVIPNFSLAGNARSTWPTWRILGVMFQAQDTERKGRQNNLIKYRMNFTYFKNQVQSKNTSVLAYCLVWMKGKNSFCNSPHPSWDGSSPFEQLCSRTSS